MMMVVMVMIMIGDGVGGGDDDDGGLCVCSGCIIQTSYLNAQALYSVHFTSHL